jgi:hypothetical protein
MRGDPPTKRQLRREETGYTGGLWEWPGYEDGLRLLGGSASSPDPFFNHGGAESLSDTTPRELTTEDTESTEDEVL